MSLEILSFFSQYIERETGIAYQDANLYQLQTRLDEITKQEKLSSTDELYRKFKTSPSPSLRQKLLDQATNNETLFFRDASFFSAVADYLEKVILPTDPKEIRIWSAAASTGQEAVSVAITIDELSHRMSLPPFSILATDISERALTRARSGLYTDFEVHRGLTTQRREQFFTNTEQGWRLKSQTLSKINYRYNNLTRSTIKGPFHLILCRNVLIYQKVECKKNVALSLFNELEPNGSLMLGVGESLLGIMEEVSPTMIGNVPFYFPHKKEKKVA